MPPERVVEHLTHVLTAENVPFEDDALWLLGRAADGSMRDAMSLTDQAIAFGEGKVLAADVRAMLGTLDHGQVYGVLHALIEGDARALIEAVRHLAEQGPDWNGVLSEMLNVLHRVAIAQALPEAVDNGQGDRERVLQLAQALPAEDVQFYYQMGLIGRRDLPLAPEPRGGFEMVLLRMLAFRPAGADDAPKVTLKPLGISQATADSQQNPVAGTAMPAPVVSAPVIAPVAQAPVVTAPVEPSPVVPAPSVTPVVSEPVQPVEVPVAPAANLPVEPEPEPEPAAPVVDVPWATAKAAEPVAEPVKPVAPAEPEVKTAEPVVSQVASVEVPAPSEVAPPVADADGGEDEPPLGDYDYVEMDAETLDYDFGQAETAAPVVEEPLPAAKPATGLAAEWLSLFPQLGLGGMTGSIAANCTLIEANGDDWLLHLDPAHSALFNPTQQRRLNDALNQQQGRSIKLRIELCKPEQETPAQAAARRRADRQRSAEASIHGDPLVQQMIQQFAAKVRDDSIEPIDIPS